MDQTILAVNQVGKTYPNGVCALKGVSFEVKRGEFVGLLGPSGSGKSTLIRSINRLVDITSGQILLGGVDIQSLKGRALRQARRRIGMIFQHYNLVERLSVMENLLHGTLGYLHTLPSLLGAYREEDKRRALQLLQDFELGNYAYHKASELSGGQKQRVGIARAVMQDPDLLLCDEPISSLDPVTSENIMNLLYTMSQQREIACIVNLHQVEFARRYATRIIGLNGGQVVYDGPADGVDERVIASIYRGAQLPEREAS